MAGGEMTVHHTFGARRQGPIMKYLEYQQLLEEWLPGLTAQSALVWDRIRIRFSKGLKSHTHIEFAPNLVYIP